MAIKSSIASHKNFNAKVRNTVGSYIYEKFISLGVSISNIKKICLKIGAQKAEIFKTIFLDKCGALIQRLEKLVASGQSYSKTMIKKIISDLFLIKANTQIRLKG